MHNELKEKNVLVTGAQQGIGRGMAVAFAAAGANVAINWLDDESAAIEVAREVESFDVKSILIHADIRKLTDIERMTHTTVKYFGGIDILINNAGVFPRKHFMDMTEEDWNFTLDINLKGCAFCAQSAARYMISSGQGGSIINLTSQSIRGQERGVHYSASKSGLLGLTRSIAIALGSYGIRVNAIAPGTVDTAQPRGGMDEDALIRVAKNLPLGRLGNVEDIANFAVFLASEKANWTTGQIYHINGGGYMP